MEATAKDNDQVAVLQWAHVGTAGPYVDMHQSHPCFFLFVLSFIYVFMYLCLLLIYSMYLRLLLFTDLT